MLRASIIAVMLFLSGSFLMAFNDEPAAIGNQDPVLMNDDTAIFGSNNLRIDNDTHLGSLASSYNWDGDGSFDDPYIIDDWDTETRTWGAGIYVGNTTSHMIFQNCDVSNITTWGSYGQGMGFYFSNASNIVVKNSISVSNRYGFYIDKCTNITLMGCNISSCSQSIQFSHSNDLEVETCWVEISYFLLYGYYSENITFRSTESRYLKGSPISSSNCKNLRFEGCTIIGDGSQSINMEYRSEKWIWESNTIHGFNVTSIHTSDVVFVNNTIKDSFLLMDFENHVEVYNNEFIRGGIYFEPDWHFRDYTQVIPQNNTVDGKPIIVIANVDLNGSRISGDPGQLIIINSTRLYASNLTFQNTSRPVSIYFCDHIRIENMTMADVGVGILASKIWRGLICDNQIVRSRSTGIELYHMPSGLVVRDNTLVGGNIGIFTEDTSYTKIESNGIYDFQDAGILIDMNSRDNEVRENILQRNSAGLRIHYSNVNYNTITHNNIKFNQKGIWIHEEAGRNTISSNNISQNLLHGIHLDATTGNNTIIGNEFWSNVENGILISGSILNTFNNNHFWGTGLFIDMGVSSQSTITPDNTMNGDPIIFIGDIDYNNNMVPSGGGQYILEFVEDAIIRELDLETTHVPILLIGSTSCWVTKCNISGSKGAGLVLKNVRACRIMDNLFRANRIGLQIFGDTTTGVQSNKIEHNDFQNNVDAGIEAVTFHGNKIRYNTFDDNHGSSINLSQCQSNRVEENTIRTSGKEGIKLYWSSYNDITGNVITYCMKGLGLYYGGGDNEISENLILDNYGRGVEIESNGFLNKIHSNAFIRNNGTTSVYDPARPQAFDMGTGNIWNNSLGSGNYWSDLLSPDEDNDGIVDVKYFLGYLERNDSEPLTELPFNLVSPPRGLETISSNGYVNLLWNAPLENMADEVIGYNVYRRSEQEDEVLVTEIQGSDTLEFNDTSMENNMIHWYSISAVNVYGEGARSEWVISYPDGEAPVIEVFNISDGSAIPTKELTIEWICYDNTSGLKSLKTKYMETGEWFDSPQNGSEEFPYLREGDHSFFIHAVDMVGNSNFMKIDFIVDLDDPQLEIISPGNSTIFDKDHFEITWAASDSGSSIHTIIINIDNGTDIEYLGSSSYEFTGLSEGPHFIQVKAIDLAGNSFQRSVYVYIDITPPVIEIPPISEGNRVNTDELLIPWSAIDPLSGISSASYKLDDGEWKTANWKQPLHVIGLANGNNILTVRVTDNAGNIAEEIITIIVDIDPPRLVLKHPEGTDIPIDTSIWVEFSKEMDQETLEILLDGISITSNWDGERLETTGDLGLDYGQDYTITIMGTDLSGNEIEGGTWVFSTQEGCCISGYIRDSNGSPIPNAVIMVGDQGPFYTAFDGSFDINARPGSYEMVIESEGYEKLVRQVELDPGGDNYIGNLVLKEESSGSEGGGISVLLIVLIGIVIVIVASLIIGFLLVRRSRSNKKDQEEETEERDIFERVEESREIARRLGFHIEVHEGEYERAMELKRLGEEEMARLAIGPYLARLESMFKELEGPEPGSEPEPPEISEAAGPLEDEGSQIPEEE